MAPKNIALHHFIFRIDEITPHTTATPFSYCPYRFFFFFYFSFGATHTRCNTHQGQPFLSGNYFPEKQSGLIWTSESHASVGFPFGTHPRPQRSHRPDAFNKPAPQGGRPGVRRITLQEALVKIVDSSLIVGLLEAVKPAIGPLQVGIGPSAKLHRTHPGHRGETQRPHPLQPRRC